MLVFQITASNAPVLLIAFQHIKPNSTISQIEGICLGDHIEKINDESMLGKRHFEVAKALKDIPQGSTFSLRVIEPMKSGFCKSLY